MRTFLDITTFLLPVAYLLVAVDYGLVFFRGHLLARRSATPLLGATLFLHAAYLTVVTVAWGQFPAATISQALSIVAFAVGVVYAIVEWHGREHSTGFWIVSLVFLLQALASLFHRPVPPDRPVLHNAVFGTHVSLGLLGYAAFVLAAAYGFLFLELYRDLKGGRFSMFYNKLPPLQVLERMMSGALAVGFWALTGAVLTGIFWGQRLHPENWYYDPMFLFTAATWILYGGALLLRRMRRWKGRQTAFASLAGLAAILCWLVTANFVLARLHFFR